MHILITGAAGMIGRKITERLLTDGHIGKREITKLTLHDIVAPDAKPNAHTSIRPIAGDISDQRLIDRLVSEKPDIVIHLAAVVSGEAEADFDKGYAVNFDGTRLLFDAIRVQNQKPRVIFASSIAVFGAPFPEPIPDDFHLTPLTCYGTQTAVGRAVGSTMSCSVSRVTSRSPILPSASRRSVILRPIMPAAPVMRTCISLPLSLVPAYPLSRRRWWRALSHSTPKKARMNAIATAVPASGPPPASDTRSMMCGMANHPAITTTRITAAATTGPQLSRRPAVTARSRRRRRRRCRW
jgi:NAD(P)-dependent dehydrogenase (short-subunit alcohol dehydrogenase family)